MREPSINPIENLNLPQYQTKTTIKVYEQEGKERESSSSPPPPSFHRPSSLQNTTLVTY